MPTPENVARWLEALPRYVGRGAALLVIAVVGLTFSISVMRYAFGISITWMQELYVWLHAIVFLLAAAYALAENAHVRVDIFYSKVSRRAQSVVDIAGTLLLLLPWLAVICVYSWPYVVASWRTGERSASAQGMPGLYILKSMLLVFAILMALQAVALIVRRSQALSASTRDELEAGDGDDSGASPL